MPQTGREKRYSDTARAPASDETRDDLSKQSTDAGKLGERGTPDEALVAHHDVEMGAPLPLSYASRFERDRELGKRALGCV